MAPERAIMELPRDSCFVALQRRYGGFMSGYAHAGSRGERFLALDSMRGLLASTVVLFHLPSDGWLWTLRYIQNGHLAVTFFFVLSGFVIGTTYGERLSRGFPVGRFLGLRLGRIYPLHLFMILLLIAYQAARLWLHVGAARDVAPFSDRFDPTLLPYNFLLLQKFAGVLSWNDPSWSIGVEWWTYVVFALIAMRIRTRHGLVVTAGLLIAPWLWCELRHLRLGAGWAETFGCMMCFGLGLIVCDIRSWALWRQTDRLGRVTGTILELVAVAAGLWMINHFGGSLSLLIAPTFAFVIAVFSLERGWVSRLLVTAPMLLIGELSYSIYMIHHFILDRMVDLVWFKGAAWHLPIRATASGRTVIAGNWIACDLFSLLVLALVIAFSVLSFRYLETPARLWSRRMLNPNHSEKVTPRDPAAAF
jgi:peptidoglycan/LPS O-acetylase OafA/YrhL